MDPQKKSSEGLWFSRLAALLSQPDGASQVEIFRISLASRSFLPASVVTTSGICTCLFCYYVGSQIDPLLKVVLLSLGLGVVVLSVTVAAATVTRSLSEGMDERGRSRAGPLRFFRSLKVLTERGSEVIRSASRWVGAGLAGFWLIGLAVMICASVGLVGRLGQILMGALLGAQVLLMACGFAWLLLVLGALILHPSLASIARNRRRSLPLFILKLLRRGPVGLSAELLRLAAGMGVVLLCGLAVLSLAYGLVLTLNSAMLEKSLMQVLSASPLARMTGQELASEPSLGLQIAGVLATLSLSAVLGLLLAIVASYWGTAALLLSARTSLPELMAKEQEPEREH